MHSISTQTEKNPIGRYCSARRNTTDSNPRECFKDQQEKTASDIYNQLRYEDKSTQTDEDEDVHLNKLVKGDSTSNESAGETNPKQVAKVLPVKNNGSTSNSANCRLRKSPNKSDDSISRAWLDLELPVSIKGKASEPFNPVKQTLKTVGSVALKTAVISGVVLGCATLVPAALGFGSAGVAAGSMAAGYQSAFLGGFIAKGSLFATLQSVGAAGIAASTQAAIIGTSAAVATATEAAKNVFKKKDKRD